MLDNNSIWGYLARSSVEFHLTGSRFFHTETDESDWDFLVKANDAIEDHLKHLKFVKLSESTRPYPSCVSAFCHLSSNVHVVSNINLERKLEASSLNIN